MITEVNIIRVKESNNFVGLRIKKKSIDVYVPWLYRLKENPLQNDKEGLINFLKSINLAKTQVPGNISNSSNIGEVWPIESFIWILSDFLSNGLYFSIERKNDYNNGTVNWKKTLKQQPMISNNQFFYTKLCTSYRSLTSNTITQIYSFCVNISCSRIGWLYGEMFKLDTDVYLSIEEMIYLLEQERSKTFDDEKRIRFGHMIKILSNIDNDNLRNSNFVFGITNYYYVFERMVDVMFGNIYDKKIYQPRSKWVLLDEKEVQANPLMPDTILKKKDIIYLIDAKLYQYGINSDTRYLPGSQSIQKQITYGDFLMNNLNISEVRNIFILPNNNEVDLFSYFGYAQADWRNTDGEIPHEKIFGFFVDLRYLVTNYQLGNNFFTYEMCRIVEEKL
ncbi:LlaJI family restriction endonuclease [Breznakia pachnodae]|uniref:LlaJI restriction endonuclease n=1 Tax=Breznakia pachnodae TaxID=265178 RepID=A0ABU0E5K2_9FIRM|nr:LlaJI family restriction endonuclease [Breznakia pachnodae]MDQ0362178.1 hypothetical protein [Breznakia pachnodae]